MPTTASKTTNAKGAGVIEDLKTLPERAEADYRKLVSALAADKPDDADTTKIGELLTLTNRNVATLEKDVATLKARRQAAANHDLAHKLKADMDAAHASLVDAMGRTAKVREEADAKVQAALQDEAKVRDIWRDMDSRRKRLLREARDTIVASTDPELEREIVRLNQWIDQLGSEEQRLNGELTRLRSVVAEHERKGARPTTMKPSPGQIEKVERRLASVQKELADSRDRIAKLRERQADPLAGMKWDR